MCMPALHKQLQQLHAVSYFTLASTDKSGNQTMRLAIIERLEINAISVKTDSKEEILVYCM